MQIDYVLDFPQAPAKRECYMRIIKGIEVQINIEWLIKVDNNIYRKRQAGRVCNKFLVENLTGSAVMFRKSKVDKWVFYRLESIYILFTCGSILEGIYDE